jgi:hypothetical protein
MKLLSVIVEGRKRQTDGRRRPRRDRLLRDMDRLVDAVVAHRDLEGWGLH